VFLQYRKKRLAPIVAMKSKQLASVSGASGAMQHCTTAQQSLVKSSSSTFFGIVRKTWMAPIVAMKSKQ